MDDTQNESLRDLVGFDKTVKDLTKKKESKKLKFKI